MRFILYKIYQDIGFVSGIECKMILFIDQTTKKSLHELRFRLTKLYLFIISFDE